MDSLSDDDDPRSVELETLTAIYPEIRPTGSRFTFELDLPVQPTSPVTILFRAPHADEGHQQEPVDSLRVSHLPALSLRLSLPDGYPDARPLQACLSTTPPWLPSQTLATLEGDGPRLWEEAGHDLVAYTYIDHVQRAAEQVFGAISAQGTLEVHPAHKLAVLDYDIKAKRSAFERETFECGVCLDAKRGSACHRMLDCGHVFCLECLGDFYSDAIQEGNLSAVRCPAPNCAKERADGGRKPKTFVSPGELLQIGLAEEVVKRYVTLKYKTDLESDKDTVYCPRRWCNGAARSERRRKPEGLEFAKTSDAEPERDAAAAPKGKSKFKPADLLCVCEDCGFAFCSRCLQTWHGEFVRCAPKRDDDDLMEEEKASLEYMQLHTSPCPTCNAPAQKTHGCNHMICPRCETHFCYLCSSWLDPANPYRHYNQQEGDKVTSCFMRLWELEGGDGDDVGLGFEGGRGAGADRQARVGELENPEPVPRADELADDSESESEDEAANGHAVDHEGGGPVAVARDAPLVIRLVENRGAEGERRGGRNEPAHPGAQPRGVRGGRGRARRASAVAPRPAVARGRGQNRPGRGRGAVDARAARAGRGRGERGGGGGGGGGGGVGVGAGQEEARAAGDADGLDAAQEAWVRRFVQMALIDAEDQVESDSDDDEWWF